MDVTLVVLAAGMGSRFGGLKQAEPITPDGKCLLDFSVYDAVRAGFNKVVFVIRRDIEQDFKQLVGNRIEKKVDVQYVMQDMSTLPEGRSKPFGTAHAVLCCKDVVKGPFAIINADDYYGRHAYDDIYAHLTVAHQGEYAMVAYKLGNTVSANGGVNRGVCKLCGNKLVNIVETRNITSDYVSQSTGERFTEDTAVSMNLWGFTSDVFPYLSAEFDNFKAKADLSKDEFLIPDVIFSAVSRGVADVTVYTNSDKWYGMTYREDVAAVRQAIAQLIQQGLYDNI